MSRSQCSDTLLSSTVSDALRLLNWNARSIRAKKIELEDFLRSQSIDVGIITETRLNSNISFSIAGFTTIRLDRSGSSRGGVAIILRKGVAYQPIPHPRTEIIEAIGVEIQTSTDNIRIFAAYCPRQCRAKNGEARILKSDLAKLTRSCCKCAET